jgi:hypothetical protein
LKLAKLPWTHKSLVEPENAKIKRQKINDFMVADAVAIEPVSRSDFPANKENNSEFHHFGPKMAIFRSYLTRNFNRLQQHSLRE